MENLKSDFLSAIEKKINDGERLSAEDGLALFKSADVLTLGRMAHEVRRRRHGRRAFYAVNLHLNPTNICSARCEFCAFSRDANAADAYALTLEEVEKRIREALRHHSINEIHIVGGHNPALGLEYYLEMMRRIRQISKEIFIKAFSAPEVDFMAKRSGLSCDEVLRRLKEAGLDGMPGGGAEIFDPEVRRKICPKKISGEEWLGIHRVAHGLGLKTNATMLYGHIETDEQRIAHLLKLRELQDETQGFSAFVPLAYHPENNALRGVRETSGFLDLKVLSISRLLLDNVPHIKAHGSATDLKFVQVALSFGADDIGGTNLHEKVMREAGSRAPEGLSSGDLIRCIIDAGFEPCCVDSSYQMST
ncbi:MAG: aminofutalosine synthase MqnE [Candidatus Omnitrophica bacterium]|nr:aminofutalosine synthase MqnE [Candidatus Omnitrophota bacterium]